MPVPALVALVLATEMSPATIGLIVGAAILLVVIALLALRKPKPPEAPKPLPGQRVSTEATKAVDKAEAAVELARRNREEAQRNVADEQAARHAKEDAARQKAEADARARL